MPKAAPWVLGAGLLGGVLPDVDMLAFYFVDHKSHHHHEYLTHRPIVCAVVTLLGALLWRRTRRAAGMLMALRAGGLTHILLDTIAGAIAWGWPLSPATTTFVIVPATHDHWILSFLTHWTFGVELAVTAAALLVFIRARR